MTELKLAQLQESLSDANARVSTLSRVKEGLEQDLLRLQGEVAAMRGALDSALERWIPMAKVVPGGWEILLTWQERNVKALAPRRG